MRASIQKYPSGNAYIEIEPANNWHAFPDFAEKLLHLIGAIDIRNISRLESVDSHWYEFVWEGYEYRLIYEDWPHQISLESITNEKSLGDLLEKIAEVLSKGTVLGDRLDV